MKNKLIFSVVLIATLGDRVKIIKDGNKVAQVDKI